MPAPTAEELKTASTEVREAFQAAVQKVCRDSNNKLLWAIADVTDIMMQVIKLFDEYKKRARFAGDENVPNPVDAMLAFSVVTGETVRKMTHWIGMHGMTDEDAIAIFSAGMLHPVSAVLAEEMQRSGVKQEMIDAEFDRCIAAGKQPKRK